MYTAHPSSRLKALFAAKPYQGAPPDKAALLFIGLDANYAADIEDTPIFPRVREYHQDGVQFWRKYRVHHPFLLPDYAGDGRHYHRSFARIGFGAEHAHMVSFVELIDVPTVGRSKLTPADLSKAHMRWLNSLVMEGSARQVFVSSRVAMLMRTTGVFNWLTSRPVSEDATLAVLYSGEGRTVYSHLHFSVYGKYEARKKAEALAIRQLVPVVG